MRKPDGTFRTYDEMVAEKLPLKYTGKWAASMNSNCDANGQGNPFAIYMYGAFLAEVNVNTKTGKTTVEGMTVMADIGKINNKLVVDGQIYGGVAQGIGLALSEDFEDIEKHSTMLGAGIPYAKDIPDKFDIYYFENAARERPVRRGRRGRTAADFAARRGRQRHLQRDRRAHHASAGATGEGAGRLEGCPSTGMTECCSYGGVMWLANPELAEKVVQRRIEASPVDYVTYCAMCRDFFARQGKPALAPAGPVVCR